MYEVVMMTDSRDPSGSGVGLLVRLEGDLKYAVSERVAVEGLDGDEGLLVVGHRDETEALALVGLEVADDLDALHGAERAEQLPQDVVLGLRGEVVDEDDPAGAVHGAVVGEQRVGRGGGCCAQQVAT